MNNFCFWCFELRCPDPESNYPTECAVWAYLGVKVTALQWWKFPDKDTEIKSHETLLDILLVSHTPKNPICSFLYKITEQHVKDLIVIHSELLLETEES